MSAGRFARSRYAAAYNTANIHPIKVQPETLNLTIGGTANEPPSQAINNPISAVASRGKNARGLRPALVSLQWTGASAATPGNVGITTVPLLNATIRTQASTADADTDIEYLGVSTWAVVGYSIEEAK